MKNIFLFILFVIFNFYATQAIAVNSRVSNDNREYAIVNTDDSADYATNAITPRKERKDSKWNQVWFSIGGSGTMTVTLQFKRKNIISGTAIDSDWEDYENYTNNEFKWLNAGDVGTQWRAVVKNGNYTSGEKIFGFSW